jgi:uncharacterized protein YrrD
MRRDLMEPMRGPVRRGFLIGLPVIIQGTGKKVGIVRELQLSDDTNTITGFYVSGNRFTKKSGLIPFKYIHSVDSHGIIISPDFLDGMQKLPTAENSIEPELLIGTSLIHQDGRELGKIADILVDLKNGRVAGVEISEGFIDDLVDGRSLLPNMPTSHDAAGTLVLTPEEAESIRPYNKGIRNIFLNKL